MRLLDMMGQPNTPGPLKFAVAGVGLGAGLASAWAINHALVGPEKAGELRKDGVEVMDSRQGQVYAMALPFGFAAGTALGLQRRTPTSGLTTASQVAAAALLSTVAGAVINADSDKASDYVAGIGVMSAATGAGIMLGVRDEVHLGVARMAGLAAFGLALGVAAPTLIEVFGKIPGAIGNGIKHRE